ncbi:MAG: STAS domain-containing protein [Acidobacteriota bacterium]
MDLKLVDGKEHVRISVEGNVDEVGAKKLEEAFHGLNLASVMTVTLDFKQVKYIGSAGIGILLLLYKKLALHQGKIVIENMPKDIYTLFSQGMNLGRVFTMKTL